MLLAVVGSVAGALVANAFTSSPNLALFGAVLGAAIPPFIAVAGPFTGVKLGAGLLISAIALVVTYGGFTAQAKVLDVPSILPVPGPAPKPKPSPTTGPTPSSPSSSTTSPIGSTCDGSRCISWTPTHLACSSDPCKPDVTVTSTGTDVLQVTGLKFTGEAASRLSPEGTCTAPKLPKSLHENEACSITVRVKPGAAGHAVLRIQQNLSGDASLVEVDLDASPPTSIAQSDLWLQTVPTVPRCSVVPGGSLSGKDNLSIFVAIRYSGSTPPSGLVPYTTSIDSGFVGTGNTFISTSDAATAMSVDINPSDYNKKHRVVMRVDPGNKIPETDETNNTLTVTVILPSRPNKAQDVACTVS